MFKNMKITVENNLDEIVAELERLSYKSVDWDYMVNFIITSDEGFYTGINGNIQYYKLTTLAELKEM